MTRKKVKLTYIANDSARKATFKKRKKGLMKKMTELSTLCDVPACAIIYSQYDSQPEVWPSPMGAQRVLAQFKTMPEMEQSKKMVNQESFLRQRIEKAREQLKKQKKENREKQMTKAMHDSLVGKSLQGLSMIDLNDLGWLIDQNLKEITDQIKSRNGKLGQKDEGQVAPAPTTVPAAADQGMVRSGETVNMDINLHAAMERQAFELNNMEALQRPPWFMMNPQEHMGPVFGPRNEIMQFGDHSHHARWSNNPYFP